MHTQTTLVSSQLNVQSSVSVLGFELGQQKKFALFFSFVQSDRDDDQNCIMQLNFGAFGRDSATTAAAAAAADNGVAVVVLRQKK